MAPSNTELLYDIHAEDNLVAVCNQCDYPASVKAKPHIGTFTTLDPERALQLAPKTVFLVDGQEAIAESINKQASLRSGVTLLHNRVIADIGKNVRTLGEMTNHKEAAEQAAQKFEQQLQQLQTIISSAKQKTVPVFLCVWPQPLTTVGTASYLNDAITICGGRNIAAGFTQAYPQFSVERLLQVQPDVIILPHEALGEHFLDNAPWTSLHAVANKRVFYLPSRDEDRLSRPTMRIIQGLCWLSERLHPDLRGRIRAFASQTEVKE